MSKASASRKFTPAVWVVAVAVLAIAGIAAGSSHLRTHANAANGPASRAAMTAEQSGRVRANLQALPLAFEPNAGQTDPQVKYMARGNGYTVFLTPSESVFAVSSSTGSSAVTGKNARVAQVKAKQRTKTAAIHMKLVNGNPQAEMAAGSELPGVSNYFIGNDPSKWQSGVKHYATVSYRDVYPGVNMAFHGQQRQVEFDFVVAPQASAAPIRLGVSGAEQVKTDAEGNLVLVSAAGNVVMHKPVAYQEINNSKQIVDARFALRADNTIGFELGEYDRARELVIDPSLSYATYLGGASEDEVFAIAVDSSKNVYVTGESNSTSGFPGASTPSGHLFDAYVTKLTSAGALSYTTFVGGTNNDSGLAIAVDSGGAAYVTGITLSSDFPASATAPEPSKGDSGGNCTNLKSSSTPCTDAFAFKLSSSGSLTTGGWATYIGGNNSDDGYGIAVDGSGNVWVAGDTFSSNFYPNIHASAVLNINFNNNVLLTPPADDGFVVEINPNGTAPFMYSTYLGGGFGDQINGVAVDASNNVYVVGQTNSADFPVTSGAYQKTCGSDGSCNKNTSVSFYDGFVTKLVNGSYSNTGGYSTYIGGSSDDYAFGIAVDGSGNAYITGQTTADDTTTSPAVPYPTTSGAFSTTYNSKATANAFVTEVKPDGSGLVYSTFLGGSVQDYAGSVTLDSFGDAYVTGVTSSADFPVTSNAVQSKLNGTGTTGHSDAFVTQVLAGGKTLGFSTYLGGSGDENANASGSVGTIALDSSNNIWVGGSTNSSTDFPKTSGAAESSYGGNPYDGFVAEYSSAAVADFNITATTPAPVSPGSSATSTVTLTSAFGYNLPVNLTCAVSGGGSPAPSCSASSAFSTNPVTPSSSGATSTLTITTTGATAALGHASTFWYATWVPILGLAFAGMGFSTGDSRRKKLLGLLLLGVVMAMLFFLPACGGGNNGGGGGGGGCSGCTPSGNYTVTITGTDANNLSHSTQTTLAVN